MAQTAMVHREHDERIYLEHGKCINSYEQPYDPRHPCFVLTRAMPTDRRCLSAYTHETKAVRRRCIMNMSVTGHVASLLLLIFMQEKE